MTQNYEEKSLIIEVTPNINDVEMVQTMLETMLTDDTLVHEDVKVEFGWVVSNKFYKGLCYGKIKKNDRDKMQKMIKDGYEQQYILCLAEMKMDPCIVYYGDHLDEFYVETNEKYIFKIKLVYARIKDDDNADKKGVTPGTKNKGTAPF
jgi:hypothetical protein